MTPEEIQRRAEATLKATNIAGERGLVVHEGFTTARAKSLDDFVGDVIPGASLLLNRARRIVLVTDRNVYVFQGPRFDRPTVRLGAFPTGSEAMSFDRTRLTFPDGQSIYVTEHQTSELAQAAGADIGSRSVADAFVNNMRITGERGVLVAYGMSLSATDKPLTVAVHALGAIEGEIAHGKTGQERIVLVTDKHIRIFRRHRMQGTAEEILGTYSIGPDVLLRDSNTIRFPDGETIAFGNRSDAQDVCEAAMLGAAAGDV
jgi:hypothetical protein